MSEFVSETLLKGELSKNDAGVLLELAHKCLECMTVPEFNDLIEGLRELVPFDFFACVQSFLNDSGMDYSFRLVSTDYPPEWLDLYSSRKYHRIDPIITEGFSNFGVQYWADTYKKHPTDKDFLSNARDFGLRRGYTCTIKDIGGSRGALISLSGKDISGSPRTAALLKLLAPHLYQCMERIVRADKLNRIPSISRRELEVLKWITHGKTTWEISVILKLSERTVKFHVDNLMKKMGASSRTHAAAIAAELGLVELD